MMYFSSLEDVMLIVVSLQRALVACYSDAAQLQVFVVIEEPQPLIASPLLGVTSGAESTRRH